MNQFCRPCGSVDPADFWPSGLENVLAYLEAC